LITPWNNYYSPDFCKTYWDIINELGRKRLLFLPAMVQQEIASKDDKLAEWLKGTHIPIREITEEVTERLKELYAKDPKHRRLVDSTRGRSVADPWVIAHAMQERAIVVTKEERITNPASQKIKIPNVCDAMGVEWIDDFDLIRRFGINFECSSPHYQR
jgi:hypothetical protein